MRFTIKNTPKDEPTIEWTLDQSPHGTLLLRANGMIALEITHEGLVVDNPLESDTSRCIHLNLHHFVKKV